MARNLVVKDNALINASYNLELVEQRLILLSIIEARATGKGITSNDKLTITASSYMNNFNTNRNTAYQALKDACNNLFERQFSFVEQTANGEKVVRTRWVSRVAYVENSASVELIFAPDVAPLISLLEKNFTSYELEQVADLSSKYAVRLYEIIIAWKFVGKTPMFAVDELRARLGILANEYTGLRNLKARVIDFALKQINEKTDISVSYEQHKQGRKIVGFTFLITQKSEKGNTSGRKTDEHTLDLFDNLTDLERQTIRQRIDEHINRLEQQGETVGEWHRGNITKKAIAERWGLDVLAEQQRKEMERQTRLAAEQAEMQAKARAGQEKAEQAEKRRNAMIAKFETLAPDEQEQVLNQVGEIVGGVLGDFYKTARQQGAAHKDPRFVSWFFKTLGC